MQTRPWIVLLLLSFVILPGCEEMGSEAESEVSEYDSDETYVPDEKTWIEHDTPAPDFTGRAASPKFQATLKAVSDSLGASASESEHIPGLFLIKVKHDTVEESLAGWNDKFFNQGVYVFRTNNHFGFGGKPDVIGVLPTTNQFEVIRVIGTDGVNYEISNAYIIQWLQDLHRKHPLIITGASYDFIEGRFQTPPGRDMALAKAMYEFCPDIVDQGVGDVDALADELQKGSLYFWWD